MAFSSRRRSYPRYTGSGNALYNFYMTLSQPAYRSKEERLTVSHDAQVTLPQSDSIVSLKNFAYLFEESEDLKFIMSDRVELIMYPV